MTNNLLILLVLSCILTLSTQFVVIVLVKLRDYVDILTIGKIQVRELFKE